MKRMQIITGHYGSGKTEYAVNLAMKMAGEMENVALADLDIVNPYFRSYEQTKMLEEAGVNVIVTSCGGVADIPALNPAVMSIFQQEKWNGVLDIGGDPIGARVLARFAHQIKEDAYDLLFVLNANRPETKDVESALNYMRGIEKECLLKVSGIVNNTHLCGETTESDVRKGAALASAVSKETGIPVRCHVAVERLAESLADLNEPVFPISIKMKKPWE